LLINAQQRMAKHRRRIVHIGGGKDEGDALGVKIDNPSNWSQALGWQTLLVDRQDGFNHW
jgi:hypothetical protein